MTDWLEDWWLIRQLMGWLIIDWGNDYWKIDKWLEYWWLIDWLEDWVIDWKIDWLENWLVGRLINQNWMIGRLINWTEWLEDWIIKLNDLKIDWLVNWLVYCVEDWFMDWKIQLWINKCIHALKTYEHTYMYTNALMHMLTYTYTHTHVHAYTQKTLTCSLHIPAHTYMPMYQVLLLEWRKTQPSIQPHAEPRLQLSVWCACEPHTD